MHILVDFDNVESNLLRRGVLALSERLIRAMADAQMNIPARCDVGLYGGWYERDLLTRSAQRIASDLQGTFPAPIRWQTNTARGVCLTRADLAFSLHADPSRHLFFTFRNRPFSATIHCDQSILQSCAIPTCPLQAVASFLTQRRCSGQSCTVTQRDFLSKGEQKLIDTMITSDLIYLAHSGQNNLVVVSSDDDLWPGIRTALALGADVTQIHTRPGRRTKTAYSQGLGSGYREILL